MILKYHTQGWIQKMLKGEGVATQVCTFFDHKGILERPKLRGLHMQFIPQLLLYIHYLISDFHKLQKF